MNLDPWPTHVAMLLGDFAVLALPWPAHRTRVVLARDDEPAPAHPTVSRAEAEVLELIAVEPRTAPALAAALQVSVGTVHTRLSRMRERALIRKVGRAWSPCNDGPSGSSSH